MKLSSPKIKKVYIFSQKSFSYISKTELFKKNFLCFRKELPSSKNKKKTTLKNLSHILGNGTF